MSFEARSIDTIQAQIIAEKNTKTDLSGLDSPSKTAIWLGWTSIWAICTSLFEQIIAIAAAALETVANTAIYGTRDWLRAKAFTFQLGDVPQLDLTSFQINYATIDEAAKIVTFCTVVDYSTGTVFVNVAKGTTPTALTTTPSGELDQFQDFIDLLAPPGITYTAQTGSADLIRILANVNFDPKYVNTIQGDVFAALREYLYNIENNGAMAVDKLLDAMNNATGVLNIRLDLVSFRSASVPYGSSTIIFSSIAGNTVPLSAGFTQQTTFGYVIEETTVGQTWTDTITFTPVNP